MPLVRYCTYQPIGRITPKSVSTIAIMLSVTQFRIAMTLVSRLCEPQIVVSTFVAYLSKIHLGFPVLPSPNWAVYHHSSPMLTCFRLTVCSLSIYRTFTFTIDSRVTLKPSVGCGFRILFYRVATTSGDYPSRPAGSARLLTAVGCPPCTLSVR